MRTQFFFVTTLGLLTIGGQASADTITADQLLSSMIDLKMLARKPSAEEFCRQFSSYDRKTRWDAEKKVIVGNDANGDFGQYLRSGPEGEVMAEMDGPGAIVRIWSANAAGIIEIFIDGEEKPRLAEDMQKLLGGKIEPLGPPIAGELSRGWNLYLPIPYQKHCKVVVKDNPKPKSLYYQVNYRTFPRDTVVESFKWPLGEDWKKGIEKVKQTLAKPGSHLAGRTPAVEESNFSFGPGKTSEKTFDGPGAIVGLEVKLTGLPEDPKARQELLRRVLVTMSFDDEKDAVRAPFGDLFGAAPGVNPYPGYPTGITADGTFYSYWYMPYRKQAHLKAENLGKETIAGTSRLLTEPLAAADDQLLYFHADWRYESPVTQFDWPLLASKGAGRYCGVALYVFNQRTGWWGEGDEKFWVDGENFPSTIGTGSEDYFGYAWCCPEPFYNAYHNQPLCQGPGNGNYTSVNRFQVPDNIPFHDSFRGTIEAYNRGTVTYASTTYWYGSRGATTDAKPVDIAAIVWPEPSKSFEIKGAIEGESLKVLAREPSYEIDTQDISGFGQFSKGKQLWLRPQASGATAEFALPKKLKPGKYKLTLYSVQSWDYGIVQWSVNGNPAGGPFDGYSPDVMSKKIDGGEVEIKDGENRLTVKITGKNEKSTGFLAGLDALKLEPSGK